MAVVLKTYADRLYQEGYIFPSNFTQTFANSGQICSTLVIFEAKVITDHRNFAP